MVIGVRRRRAGQGVAAYRRAKPPRGGTPWREAPWCAVDLEMTGLDPSAGEIIAVGAVPIRDGVALAGEALYRLARPNRDPAPESIEIHGIRPADLAGAAPLGETLDELAAVMAGCALVAHAAWIERAFLAPALRGAGARLRGPMADTSTLGRLWLHDRDGRPPAMIALTDLAHSLGLPVHHRHHALGDALTTAQAFLALATHLDRAEPQTVRSLAEAGRQVSAIETFGGAS